MDGLRPSIYRLDRTLIVTAGLEDDEEEDFDDEDGDVEGADDIDGDDDADDATAAAGTTSKSQSRIL